MKRSDEFVPWISLNFVWIRLSISSSTHSLTLWIHTKSHTRILTFCSSFKYRITLTWEKQLDIKHNDIGIVYEIFRYVTTHNLSKNQRSHVFATGSSTWYVRSKSNGHTGESWIQINDRTCVQVNQHHTNVPRYVWTSPKIAVWYNTRDNLWKVFHWPTEPLYSGSIQPLCWTIYT
jgi:hypothetical protein